MCILVVGDAMKDRWWLGVANRISPEAPVPVVKIEEQVVLPGGAANVARNLGVMGVEARLVGGPDLPVKNRLVVGGQILARWDEERVGQSVLPKLEQLAATQYEDMKNLEGIVVSDYGKGSVTPDVVKWCMHVLGFHSSKIPLFVDTKTPQKWVEQAPLVWGMFPNRAEFAAHKTVYAEFPLVINKLGPQGIRAWRYGVELGEIPGVPNVQVRSVVGAGDVVLAAWVWGWLHWGKPTLVQLLGGEWRRLAQFANTMAARAIEGPLTAVVPLFTV